MYLAKILDELTRKSARFVLEKSTTDRCYKVKAVYSFADEEIARQMYDELSKKRGPKSKAPTTKKTT